MPPPRTGAPRSFTVGETIHFRSRISIAGTKTPTDPALVRLTSLKHDGTEVLVSALDFSREAQGEYVLTLQTDALSPGTYEVVVVHSDGPEKVTLATDRFVLYSE